MQKTIMEDSFTEIFNLPINEVEKQEYIPVKHRDNSTTTDIDNDYKYARENLYGIIEKGTDALDTLVEIANQSESPRAFEIVSTLIKTLTEANKDLLEVQFKLKKLKEEEAPTNVTNALFIGNTAELQKLIKDRKQNL